MAAIALSVDRSTIGVFDAKKHLAAHMAGIKPG